MSTVEPCTLLEFDAETRVRLYQNMQLMACSFAVGVSFSKLKLYHVMK